MCKKYYQRHRTQLIEYQLLHYYLNRNEILKKYKEKRHSEEHRERLKEYQHQYYIKNRVRLSLLNKLRWCEKRKNKVPVDRKNKKKEKEKRIRRHKERLRKNIVKNKKTLSNFKYDNVEDNLKIYFD
jgi:hypothetical protein